MHLLLFLIHRRWKQSKRMNFKGSWKNSSRLAHTVKNLRYYFGSLTNRMKSRTVIGMR